MPISWPLERGKDRRARASLTRGALYRLWLGEWAVPLAASVGLALAASIVSVSTAWLQTLREGRCASPWYATRQACDDWHDWPVAAAPFMYIGLSLIYSLLAALLVVKWAPGAAHSGIPETLAFFQGEKLPRAVPFVVAKLLGIGLVVASGLWLGQEAPLIPVVAATTAAVAGQLLPISEARVRDLALASSAAGISAALSAPLGGVVFALELFLPSRAVLWRMFVCSMLATLVLQGLVAPSSARGGLVVPETGLFRVSYDRVWHGVELVPFALLGLLGGVYGSLVAPLGRLPGRLYARRPMVAVVLVTAVTAALGFATRVGRMPGTELLAELFAECRESGQDQDQSYLCAQNHVGGLVYTAVLGAVLFPLSVTLPVPSGIVFPLILLGALQGRLMGLAMRASLGHLPSMLSSTFCPDQNQQCITPGVYALVGAAAMLTGTTRLTAASAVLMTEITGAISFIVPIMTAVIVSKWTADTLSAASLSFDPTDAFQWALGLCQRDYYSSLTSASNQNVDLEANHIMPSHRDRQRSGSPDLAQKPGTRAGYPWYSPKQYQILPDQSIATPDLYASEIMLKKLGIRLHRTESRQSPNLDSLSGLRPTGDVESLDSIPIVGPDGEYLALFSMRAQQFEPTIILTPQATLRLVVSSMTEIGLRTIVVCTAGQLEGLITRNDVVNVLENAAIPVVSANIGTTEFDISDTEQV